MIITLIRINTRIVFILLLVGILLAILVEIFGRGDTIEKLVTNPSARKRIVDIAIGARLDRLYISYLNQDCEGARNALMFCEKILIEEASPAIRDKGMWLCYARLYVLELRCGDADQAAVAFEKAKYWYLVKLESSGCKTEKIKMKLDAFTPEKCRDYIEKWDAGFCEKDAVLKQGLNDSLQKERVGK